MDLAQTLGIDSMLSHPIKAYWKRHYHWAHMIADILTEQPESRVLIYGGGSHFGANDIMDSFNGILEVTHRFKSVVVAFAGA